MFIVILSDDALLIETLDKVGEEARRRIYNVTLEILRFLPKTQNDIL